MKIHYAVEFPRGNVKPFKKKPGNFQRRPTSLEKAVTTFSRDYVEMASSFRDVMMLYEQKLMTDDKKEKIRINGEIRKIKQSKISINRDQRTEIITDLRGEPMGVVYIAPKEYVNGKPNVTIGDTTFIKNVLFDFVKARKREEFCIRSTAYLTEEGIEGLKSYIKRFFRQRFKYENKGRGSKEYSKVSNKKIRDELKKRNTYDIVVTDMILAHLNILGKIEILTSGLEAGMLQKVHIDDRCSKYVKYSPSKIWVKESNKPLNLLIGRSFYTLSRAIGEIYKNY